MFTRFFIAASATLFVSTAAYANCSPCTNSGAYSVEVQNGVTVMRGNIPSIRNPRNTLIAQRNAAEQRAEDAQLQARRSERAANRARAELAARPVIQINTFGNTRSPRSRFNSGNFRFGASISGPQFGKRGRAIGARGRNGISRPTFTRRIRS